MTADETPALGLLYTTWPDEESAAAAAETLLGEELIACANILGRATSIFRWEGEARRETEIIALFKTAPERANALSRRLAELHPYEEPCILALDVAREASAPGFLAWARAETMTKR